MTCVTSGRNALVIGDSEGGITLCNEDFSLRRFVAHESCVNFAYQVFVSVFLDLVYIFKYAAHNRRRNRLPIHRRYPVLSELGEAIPFESAKQ